MARRVVRCSMGWWWVRPRPGRSSRGCGRHTHAPRCARSGPLGQQSVVTPSPDRRTSWIRPPSSGRLSDQTTSAPSARTSDSPTADSTTTAEVTGVPHDPYPSTARPAASLTQPATLAICRASGRIASGKRAWARQRLCDGPHQSRSSPPDSDRSTPDRMVLLATAKRQAAPLASSLTGGANSVDPYPAQSVALASDRCKSEGEQPHETATRCEPF